MVVTLFCRNISHFTPTFSPFSFSRTISLQALQRKMTPIPKYSDLGPGVPVSIILKADQRTGKLTAGTIADILTRGDHPRGVKVRLKSGAVGRVQSLAAASPQLRAGGEQHIATIQDGEQRVQAMAPRDYTVQEDGLIPSRNYRFQEDFRKAEPPAASEVASLADYIKAPSRNKKKKGRASVAPAAVAPGASSALASSGGDELQGGQLEAGGRERISELARLESEFPNMDAALVAAILGDYGSVTEARAVLTSLS